LRADDGAGARRFDARAHVRDAVDLHQAVRARAAAAEEPARPVVLEAAREHAAAAGEERGGDRVALVALDGLVVEEERERPAAVDPLAGLRLEPHTAGVSGTAGGVGSACGGDASSVLSTSFVRVSRSARNQTWQP